MKIRRLEVSDYQIFREIRQQHLDLEPQSVSTSANEFRQAPREKVEALLNFTDSRADDFILGAFEEDKLIAVLGFKRENYKEQVAHKATLWGLFVTPEKRNNGTAKMLLTETVKIAKSYSWCEMIRVMITSNCDAAIKVAEAIGFQRYGLEKRSLKVGDCYLDHCYYNKYV